MALRVGRSIPKLGFVFYNGILRQHQYADNWHVSYSNYPSKRYWIILTFDSEKVMQRLYPKFRPYLLLSPLDLQRQTYPPLLLCYERRVRMASFRVSTDFLQVSSASMSISSSSGVGVGK